MTDLERATRLQARVEFMSKLNHLFIEAMVLILTSESHLKAKQEASESLKLNQQLVNKKGSEPTGVFK